jgi:hypothetical protein
MAIMFMMVASCATPPKKFSFSGQFTDPNDNVYGYDVKDDTEKKEAEVFVKYKDKDYRCKVIYASVEADYLDVSVDVNVSQATGAVSVTYKKVTAECSVTELVTVRDYKFKMIGSKLCRK